MTTAAPLLHVAPFDAGLFPLRAIAVWSLTVPWTLSHVLIRVSGAAVEVHPTVGINASDASRADDWGYYEHRLRDGDGGNGHTYEIAGFETMERDDVPAIADASFDEATTAEWSPLREHVGVLLAATPPNEGVLPLPLFVLYDDRGRLHVIPRDPFRIDRYSVHLRYRASARWTRFRSAALPARDGARSWQINPGISVTVGYAHRGAELSFRDAGAVSGVRPVTIYEQ